MCIRDRLQEIVVDKKAQRLAERLLELLQHTSAFLPPSTPDDDDGFIQVLRSFMESVVAALDHMNAVDLVYGNLRIENIVVADSHVKQTNSGACREVEALAP